MVLPQTGTTYNVHFATYSGVTIGVGGGGGVQDTT